MYALSMIAKRTATITSLMLLGCSLFFSPAQASMGSRDAAKKAIIPIYAQLNEELGQATTFYCGCPIYFTGQGNRAKWAINLDTCDYKVRKNKARANRIEVFSVVPASEFGGDLDCWQNGGRKGCSTDRNFRRMDGDLHNLFPSIGELNGDRLNFQFTDWGAQPGMYGKCEMVVNFKGKTAQPPHAARGPIARTYIYMHVRYGVKLSRSQLNQFEAWDKMYPPTKFECRRNELITKVQGNDNPYITERCPIR